MTISNKEDNFKLNYFLEIEDKAIECLDRHFELCKNSEFDIRHRVCVSGLDSFAQT